MIFSLPPELIVLILQYTSFKDVGRCAQVSRDLYQITNDSVALQYMVELGLSGLIDNPDANRYSVLERLIRLRKQEATWWNLSWSNRERIPIDGPTSFYDLRGGVCMRGAGVRRGGTVAHADISILPSTVMGTPGQVFSLKNLPEQCCAFTIDPRQNLLIWVEVVLVNMDISVSLHICNLSDGLEHPNAQVPVIRRRITALLPEFKLCVIDDLVSCSVDRSGLSIWDWRQGGLKHFQPVDDVRFYEFAFLSSTSFILCLSSIIAVEIAAVQLYSLPTSKKRDQSSGPTSARYIASFALPPVKPNVYIRLRCRSDPPPSAHPFTSSSGDASGLPELKPFNLPPESRILEFSLHVSKIGQLCSYTIIVPARAFLSRLNDKRTSAPQESSFHVPWDEWGPETRWINPHHARRDEWFSYVYGSRYAELIPAARAEHHHLVVYDFNPYIVQLSRASCGEDQAEYEVEPSRFYSTDSDLDVELMEDEEFFFDPDYFDKEVTRGRAPCRVAVSGPFKGSAVMSVAIDEERMILIELGGKSGRQDHPTAISIYTP